MPRYTFSRDRFLVSPVNAVIYKANPILRNSIDTMHAQPVENGMCCGYGPIPNEWCDEVKHESSLRRYVREILKREREETR